MQSAVVGALPICFGLAWVAGTLLKLAQVQWPVWLLATGHQHFTCTSVIPSLVPWQWEAGLVMAGCGENIPGHGHHFCLGCSVNSQLAVPAAEYRA